MSFWVITVDRASGAATSELVDGQDSAWLRSIEIERDATKFSTVIRRAYADPADDPEFQRSAIKQIRAERAAEAAEREEDSP